MTLRHTFDAAMYTWKQRSRRVMPGTVRKARAKGRIADGSEDGKRRPAVARRPCAEMACGPHDAPWSGDVRSDRPSLRPGRASAPPRPSLLVPGIRSRDGDGLALLRHH